MKEDYPYPECYKCRVLDDCPFPEVANDMLGSPLPPANCPHPMEVMRRTVRKHKLDKREAKN